MRFCIHFVKGKKGLNIHQKLIELFVYEVTRKEFQIIKIALL